MTTPTLYQPHDSRLHRLHPLTKLALIGVTIVAGAVVPNTLLVLTVYMLLLIPLAAAGKVLRTFLRSSLLLAWPFALSLFLIQGFFAPGQNVLLHIGPLSLKLEGVLLAAAYTARILVWLGSVIIFMLITRPDQLMLALTERGLPRQVGYIILTALQIIPRFQNRAQTILDSQRARGLETEGNLIQRFKALVPLVAPLILSSILELDERAIALEARGFSRSGPRTSLTQLSDSSLQSTTRWLLLALIVVLIIARIVGWFSL